MPLMPWRTPSLQTAADDGVARSSYRDILKREHVGPLPADNGGNGNRRVRVGIGNVFAGKSRCAQPLRPHSG